MGLCGVNIHPFITLPEIPEPEIAEPEITEEPEIEKEPEPTPEELREQQLQILKQLYDEKKGGKNGGV